MALPFGVASAKAVGISGHKNFTSMSEPADTTGSASEQAERFFSQEDSPCQTPYWLPILVFGGGNVEKAALVAALGQR